MKRMIDNKDYEALKNDVNDITNNKLPQYVKAKIDDESHHTFVSNVNNSENRYSSLQYTNATDENNFINYSVGVNSSLGVYMSILKKASGVETSHVLTFDENGDLKIDGNNVGGEDKQLYLHTIYGLGSPTQTRIIFEIINDVSTAMTQSEIAKWLYDNEFRTAYQCKMASGMTWGGSSESRGFVVGVYSESGTSIRVKTQRYDASGESSTSGYNSPTYVDTIIKPL